MRDGRGQEYLDENFCTHDDVIISHFEIVRPNSLEDVLITIQCDKCGEKQKHTLDLEQMVWDLELGWNE